MCRLLCFVAAGFLMVVQAIIVAYDSWRLATMGFANTLFAAVFGTGEPTAFSATLSSMIYWALVAWASFWFVIGMGCWHWLDWLRRRSAARSG
ncbi:MAG TPA: hypothetical protein VMU12_02905 [Candidatus Paceibacterota bacterium]|nr:hypothetical protein [Candidatus Paceibacterota bacterium]